MRRDFREMVKELKERGSNITKINGVSVDQLEDEQNRAESRTHAVKLWLLATLSVVSWLSIHYNHAHTNSCSPADIPVAINSSGDNIDDNSMNENVCYMVDGGDGRIYNYELEEALKREEENLRQYAMPVVEPSVDIDPAPGELEDF